MSRVKTVSEGVWLAAETVELDELTIAEGASIAAPEGKGVTLSVDGVGTEIAPGAYKGNIVVTVADNFFMPPTGIFRHSGPTPLRTAVCIVDNKVDEARSVKAVVQGGEVTGSKTSGITITDREESFNGILVTGDSEYAIDNVKLDFVGDGGNDFVGFGAGIVAVGNSRVTVDNSDISIHGVTRCAVHVGEHGEATVNNSNIRVMSDYTTKMQPAWMLGLRGYNRATQLCDYGVVTYNNCTLSSNGWGVLSVDGSVQCKMQLNDCTVNLMDEPARGYGVFSIGDCFTAFDRCTFNVNGYPILMNTEEGGGAEFKNCTVNSPVYGALIFKDDGGHLEISGSTFNTDRSTIVAKGSNTTLNISNSVFNPKNGVVLQLMDNDEPGMRAAGYKVPIGETDVPEAGRDLFNAVPDLDFYVNLSDMEVTGDMYNSSTNLRANLRKVDIEGPTGMTGALEGRKEDPDPERQKLMAEWAARERDLQGAKNVEINLKNTKVTGVISSAKGEYAPGVEIISTPNNEELSNITQTAAPTINNGVIVTLDAGSVWNVTGTSYVTKLVIAKGASVNAAGGKALKVTIDGRESTLAAGTYTGKIVLEIA